MRVYGRGWTQLHPHVHVHDRFLTAREVRHLLGQPRGGRNAEGRDNDPSAVHAGLPPEEGAKTGLNIWMGRRVPG